MAKKVTKGTFVMLIGGILLMLSPLWALILAMVLHGGDAAPSGKPDGLALLIAVSSFVTTLMFVAGGCLVALGGIALMVVAIVRISRAAHSG